MAVQYTIAYESPHVVVHVSGVPDRESVSQMWRDITVSCRENRCYAVLGLSATDRSVALEDALDYASIFEEAGVTPDYRIAWVQSNQAAMVMIELISEMTRNRKLAESKVFSDEAEARRWLAEPN